MNNTIKEDQVIALKAVLDRYGILDNVTYTNKEELGFGDMLYLLDARLKQYLIKKQ